MYFEYKMDTAILQMSNRQMVTTKDKYPKT